VDCVPLGSVVEIMAYSGASWLASPRGKVNSYVIEKILPQLNDDQILVDTSSITPQDQVLETLHADKIAVCYSSIDWENTNCIALRKDAHAIIQARTQSQIHIGNTSGKYFFSYWVEFIRQNPEHFFDDIYLADPNIEKLYLCLNRKDYHLHRKFLLSEFDKRSNLAALGIISRPSQPVGTLHYNYKTYDDGEHNNSFPNDIYSLGDPRVWNKFFVNVVTESCVHSNVFFSEKTWKPIIGLRPFMILGDDAIYTKLHELGFDTFDDIFGTWWEEPTWQGRACAILSILENFSVANPDLNTLYKSLYPRLLKNRQRFISYMFENHEKICNLNI
jgi:hypothetical protein